MNSRRVVCLLVLLVFPSGLSAQLSSLTWQQIVQKHEQALERLESFDVQYREVTLDEKGNTVSTSDCRITRWDSRSERCTLHTAFAIPGQPSTSIVDLFIQGDRFYKYDEVFVDQKRSRPPFAVVGSFGRLQSTDDQQALLWHRRARSQLLLEHVLVGDPPRTLSEEIRDSEAMFGAASVEVAQESVGGAACWRITYRNPGQVHHGQLYGRGDRISLFFDPQANFLMRRELYVQNAVDGTGQTVTDKEVLEFTKIGEGVFFPRKTQIINKTPQSERRTIVQVEHLHVGLPIDESRRDFQFPEGTMAVEYKSWSRHTEVPSPDDLIHLVGAGGKFVRTFVLGSEEFIRFRSEQIGDVRLKASAQRRRLAWSAIALVVLVLGICAYSYWHRRKVANHRHV
ncbi:MAG: hypothetical protein KatS3mg110_1040 [Pirellulaceae bacterium]|nr:MAG: hypothetical protein KatS3mg110_1040 [Pirellulaceae bacterium]